LCGKLISGRKAAKEKGGGNYSQQEAQREAKANNVRSCVSGRKLEAMGEFGNLTAAAG